MLIAIKTSPTQSAAVSLILGTAPLLLFPSTAVTIKVAQYCKVHCLIALCGCTSLSSELQFSVEGNFNGQPRNERNSLGGFSYIYAQVLNPRKGEIRGYQLYGLGFRGFAPAIKILF